MRPVLAILIVLMSVACVKAQEDILSRVIKTIFYDKRVYEMVFFEYTGVGEFPHVLSKGKYAFIYPDSVFQQYYPNIDDKLSMTWGLERKLYTMTYIRNPLGIVFIKSNINSDANLKYYIVFNEIQIFESEAKLKFRTSCNCSDSEDGIITAFDVKVIYKRNRWKIKHLEVSKIKGCR